MKARKINLLNILVIATVVLCIIGTLLIINNKTALDKVIKGKEQIAIKILIQDTFSEEREIFKAGDYASITIRNNPTKKLQIISIEERDKPFISYDRTGTYKIPHQINNRRLTDDIVTLKDTAIITNDGYVIDGSKIKIGNQIVLEGFDYRLNGKVIDIYPLENKVSTKN